MAELYDPRNKNYSFDSQSEKTLVSDYLNMLRDAVLKIERTSIERFVDELEHSNEIGGHIFIAGNGGSSAIAEHMACDFLKGTYYEDKFKLRVTALTSNSSLCTAIGNDFGYENIFAFQLQVMARKGDLVILISSSGESQNVLKAVNTSKALGLRTIGLTGFNGGSLKQLVDLSIHVGASHYGIVEDAHMHVCHFVTQILQEKYGD